MATLTAEERETIIRTSDADNFWIISTHQKPKITQLEKLVKAGVAEKVADLSHGSSPGGEYKVAANMITIRNSSRRGRTRPEVVTCQGLTRAGKSCNMVALENGYCFKHQDQVPKRTRSRKKK